jgi:hypothetical protein
VRRALARAAERGYAGMQRRREREESSNARRGSDRS